MTAQELVKTFDRRFTNAVKANTICFGSQARSDYLYGQWRFSDEAKTAAPGVEAGWDAYFQFWESPRDRIRTDLVSRGLDPDERILVVTIWPGHETEFEFVSGEQTIEGVSVIVEVRTWLTVNLSSTINFRSGLFCGGGR